MADYGEVCVLIPTYNEAGAIGDVIDGFQAEGLDNILVIDGGSEDDTRRIAADHGARVVQQSGSGKGQAVREAFELIDASTSSWSTATNLSPGRRPHTLGTTPGGRCRPRRRQPGSSRSASVVRKAM